MRYLIPLLVLLISGCVNTPIVTEKVLLLKLDANPKEVFSNGITTISADVENNDEKTLENVNVDIFEIGSFDFVDKTKCVKSFGTMDPKDFKTLACNLRAKNIDQPTDNKIWVRAKYTSKLAAVQTFDILSQTEYETRKRTGKTTETQKSFSFRDSNLEMTMELSDSPIVDGQNKKEFVTFRITNIGSGFIDKLSKDAVTISWKNTKMDCQKQDIFISGREFPRFTCAINLDGTTSSFITAEISININYEYEIRNSIDVRILKGGEPLVTTPVPATTTSPTPTATPTTPAPGITPTPETAPVWIEYTGDVLPTKVEGESKWAVVTARGLFLQQIENGVLHVESEKGPASLYYNTYNPEATYAKSRSKNNEFTLETRLKILDGEIGFRIRPHSGTGEMSVELTKDEVRFFISEEPRRQIDNTNFHTYRIVLTEKELKVYVDNNLFLSRSTKPPSGPDEFVQIIFGSGDYYLDYLKHTDDGAFPP